ncbi:hypothetical protein [Burkholderia gladioli]|uniref:hypothetical protein n=1 Tax=Burkholderia gladioli TaxID=28095 RepID=UPI001C220065|nr:hypothetical protein [Burkholderia gladioli]MBU9175905.1 hypothetical protein [Burkholderia gladioli]
MKSSNQMVFYPKLDEFCRKYLIKQAAVTKMDELLMPQRFVDIKKSLFEQFLLFDSISFKVYGENIPLAFLLHAFGKKGLDALIEQKAINFVHWTQNIVHFVTEVTGVNPLGHGKFTSEAHSDPEKSVALAAQWMPRLRKKEMAALVNKVVPLYSRPREGLAETAIKATESAFHSGKLVGLGLDPEKIEITAVPLPMRKLMGKCADEVFEYSLLQENQMTSFSNFEYFYLFNESATRIANISKTMDGFRRIAEMQDIPDFKIIFDAIESPLLNVPKIRNKRSSKKFRAWLAGAVSGESGHSVTREYTEAVAEGKGFFQTNTGKVTKAVLTTSIGTGVATILDARLETAVIASLAASKVVDPLVDLGLDLLDTYVLDGLTKGWTPKLFFDDLERWVGESKAVVQD